MTKNIPLAVTYKNLLTAEDKAKLEGLGISVVVLDADPIRVAGPTFSIHTAYLQEGN